MVAQNTDLIVLDVHGAPFMAVEVDNKEGLNSEKAIGFRSRVAPYLSGGSARVLMLASQDRAFLWKDNNAAPPDAAPDAEFSMAPILSKYAATGSLEPGERMRGSELEIIVWQWLTEMTWSEEAAKTVPVPAELGSLMNHLLGGRVLLESAK